VNPNKAYLAIIKPKGADGSGGGGEIGRVTFDYNPKEYNYRKGASWDRKPAKGAKSAAPPEFKGAEPSSMTVEVFLDGYESGRDISPQIKLLTSCCVPLPETLKKKHPSPPWVIFGWGTQIHITAYVKSVDVKCTLFQPDGTPLRATCTVAMEEIADEVGLPNPTSHGFSALRSRTVVAGDTLQSIAYQEYGDPGAWRVVARANGIDDPMRVPTGSRLLIPDLDQALDAVPA
jgi:nucleoid-associated protein YgaU